MQASNFVKRQELNLAFFIALFFASVLAHSAVYVLPDQHNTVGETEFTHPEIGETLAEVGYRYNMGLAEMTKANPNVAPNQVLTPSTKIIIPSKFQLPQKYRTGIVIQLKEYRLYFFPPNENVVFTYPVGVGREGWETPLGKTRIIAKETHPEWHPTKKIREQAEKKGFIMPESFPAGSYNPLGDYALRLGWPTFLIHGSNSKDGIGTKASAGCIRMLPNDIEELFSMVSVGTVVRITN